MSLCVTSRGKRNRHDDKHMGQRHHQSPLPHLSRKGGTVNLRELAEAAKKTWPLEDDAVLAFAAACSPERILALLDVVEAAEGTAGHMTASSKTRWWREDGMAGGAVADRKLRAALTRWREVSR
jgi:hypothetical protein